MMHALIQAKQAFDRNEVPIGAVVVYDNNIIVATHNLVHHLNDPIAHAEMLAIKKSYKLLPNKYLFGCDLYVTLEPCAMCAQAISFTRMNAIYFGSYDKKFGSISSNIKIFDNIKNNWKTNIYPEILEKESTYLIQKFFQKRRFQK